MAVTRARSPWTLPLFLAWRALGAAPVTTALLVLAVAASEAFQIANAANLIGYRDEMIAEGVSAGFGDVRVRPREGASIERASALIRGAAALRGVRAVVPLIMRPGVIGKKGVPNETRMFGIDPDTASKPFRLAAGSPLAPGDHAGILVGVALADRAGIAVGDRIDVRIVLATAPGPLEEEAIGRYTLTVRGLVGGTFGAFESAFVNRSFLEIETGASDEASMILVYGSDPFAAASLAREVGALDAHVRAAPWMDDSPYLRSAVGAAEAVGAVSQAMAIAAVAFPVLALLYINMLQRRREVGVLGAVGFGRGAIFASFVAQALAVGLAGTAIGALAGDLLAAYFRAHPIFSWQGFVIRPVLSVEVFARPSLVVLATTLAASAYPAWRAARLEPAAVLRSSP